MPPKVKFEREDVIGAAFAIVCDSGLAALTARSVAERLGSSVAPLYANFASLEELTAAVVQQAYSLSGEILARQQGEDMFTNIGKASLELARLYPVLFRELALNPALHSASYADMEAELVTAMGESSDMTGWSTSERRRLLLKVRIFHLGLSMMMATGELPRWLRTEEAENLLFEAGADFVAMEQSRREVTKK